VTGSGAFAAFAARSFHAACLASLSLLPPDH